MSRLLLVTTLLGLAAACNPVYTTQPVGEKPRNLTEDKDQWEGTWVNEDGAITVAVANAEKGLIRIGWFEKSKGVLTPKAYDIELRTSGKWTFANVKDPDRPRYLLARVERNDRQTLVWLPVIEKWKALVKAKQLPGTLKELKKDESELTVTLGPKDVAYIMAEEHTGLFQWEKPAAFIKVTK